MAALLARIVREQGRDAEAQALCEAAEHASAADDLEAQALWRMVRAPIAARAGDVAQAEAWAREAVEFAQRTEAPVLQGDALAELAAVLRLAGKTDEAAQAAAEAVALFTAKGNAVAAARAAALMAVA